MCLKIHNRKTLEIYKDKETSLKRKNSPIKMAMHVKEIYRTRNAKAGLEKINIDDWQIKIRTAVKCDINDFI